MCAALRSEEGGGSRMRVRPERDTSFLRSARTLTPTPLPEGEGLKRAGTLMRATSLGLQTASAVCPSGHPLRGCSLRHPAFAVACGSPQPTPSFTKESFSLREHAGRAQG